MDFPILIIGESNQPEFREPCAQLLEHGATAAANVAAALELLHANFSPALIVIAQRWPGEFSHRELAELKRGAPLARLVGLLGPWLEGEARTGKPWPTMRRVYWHQALARQARDLESLENVAEENSLSWTLPITSSDDERTLAMILAESIRSDTGAALYDPIAPLIAIHSPHRETAESLAGLCAQQHWNTIWLREPPAATPLHAAAVLVDVRLNLSTAISNIRAMKVATGDAPIIALVGFPRADDVQSLRAAVVSAVVSKPFLAADLLWQIEQFVAPKLLSLEGEAGRG